MDDIVKYYSSHVTSCCWKLTHLLPRQLNAISVSGHLMASNVSIIDLKTFVMIDIRSSVANFSNTYFHQIIVQTDLSARE